MIEGATTLVLRTRFPDMQQLRVGVLTCMFVEVGRLLEHVLGLLGQCPEKKPLPVLPTEERLQNEFHFDRTYSTTESFGGRLDLLCSFLCIRFT